MFLTLEGSSNVMGLIRVVTQSDRSAGDDDGCSVDGEEGLHGLWKV